ncbi:peptidoglycan editing factor PgeF [Curvibacter sp. APW13]|uniref:peptidoglycan editing factor PgeF n=1 Tax=Curvibacter sp. APW13 TaxID=3077236 RepID=UPI0028DEFAEF|nr:peptidoglycan editing factor PgeF [Curvibacter sp. APW13]MDT8991787.1 peptidoglycan editing factor PgeF [Curvibacter sp. APW13]
MHVCSLTEEAILRPQWPVPANVRAVFTTRQGGCSPAPYESLNLGTHVGDDPAAVAANRTALRQWVGLAPNYLEQVHGTAVLELVEPLNLVPCADGSASAAAGVVCTVMVADCLPILLSDSRGRWVAALHAGWRGLLGTAGVGVVEQGVAAFSTFFQAESRHDAAYQASELIAWLGPCIGPAAFEVGDEVRAAFVASDAGAAACFVAHHGKWLSDLPALARRRLAACGVTRVYGNDGSLPWCTVSNPGRFFSHRRDRVSGRMAACIWLDAGL